MTEGYRALTTAAALLDLTARTRIRLTGEDRARLLHALTTNHIQQLLPEHGCYAFFLNAQGRILADANILAFPDYLLIDAEPEVRHSLFAHIDHYIIADDAVPHDDTETTFSFGVEGPAAEESLSRLGCPSPKEAFEHHEWNGLTVARISWTGEPGFRFFGPREAKSLTIDQLYLTEATLEDAEIVRIEHGIPRFGEDIAGTTLPAETGRADAVHSQKGCYLGQEIVERVRSRGHINKRLVHLAIDSASAPPKQSKVLSGDGAKEAGEITSSAQSPSKHRTYALAQVRVPFDRPGTILQVQGARAEVLK